MSISRAKGLIHKVPYHDTVAMWCDRHATIIIWPIFSLRPQIHHNVLHKPTINSEHMSNYNRTHIIFFGITTQQLTPETILCSVMVILWLNNNQGIVAFTFATSEPAQLFTCGA